MLEVRMEACLLRGDASELVSVLHHEGLSSVTLSRLDKLVTEDLRGSAVSRVLVVLKSLDILSENRGDLETLLSHGLTSKVLLWFEVLHDLLTCDLLRSSTPLLRLAEAFYDHFLLLAQASLPASQLSVVLLQLARFSMEPEFHFPVRLEAIRTYNSILDCLRRDERRLIQNDQSQTQILCQMAGALLSAGDYELQVSLSEALCRLTPRKDRAHRAHQWFSSRDVSRAFCDIKDKDFEVDCRRFLNFVNSFHGDKRRVYSFPCLQAFLDSTELFPPNDDKLDKFWVDFNLSSGCVSFFIDDPQGSLWGSVHLLRDKVDHYSLQLKPDKCAGTETVLSVQLNNPITQHSSTGQTVKLSFDAEHHGRLEEAAGRVFMTQRSSDRVTGLSAPVGESSHSARLYDRKKNQSKSHLKILHLSSPSSEEDSCVMKRWKRNTAEFKFDQIRRSTLVYNSEVPVGAGISQETELRRSSSPSPKEVLRSDRKRAARDSGYLSDQTEGPSAHRRRAEPLPDDSVSQSAGGPDEGAESPEEEEEEEEQIKESVERQVPVLDSGAEPKSDMTADITAAFNAFKTQLEQHFASCWRNVETEVILSLQDCQQHVSSLLTAVHQHRLELLQTFENITDQLKQLEEKSTKLSSINSQILSFFRREVQRLGSFCEERLQRLKSLDSEDSASQQPANE